MGHGYLLLHVAWDETISVLRWYLGLQLAKSEQPRERSMSLELGSLGPEGGSPVYKLCDLGWPSSVTWEAQKPWPQELGGQTEGKACVVPPLHMAGAELGLCLSTDLSPFLPENGNPDLSCCSQLL